MWNNSDTLKFESTIATTDEKKAEVFKVFNSLTADKFSHVRTLSLHSDFIEKGSGKLFHWIPEVFKHVHHFSLEAPEESAPPKDAQVLLAQSLNPDVLESLTFSGSLGDFISTLLSRSWPKLLSLSYKSDVDIRALDAPNLEIFDDKNPKKGDHVAANTKNAGLRYSSLKRLNAPFFMSDSLSALDFINLTASCIAKFNVKPNVLRFGDVAAWELFLVTGSSKFAEPSEALFKLCHQGETMQEKMKYLSAVFLRYYRDQSVFEDNALFEILLLNMEQVDPSSGIPPEALSLLFYACGIADEDGAEPLAEHFAKGFQVFFSPSNMSAQQTIDRIFDPLTKDEILSSINLFPLDMLLNVEEDPFTEALVRKFGVLFSAEDITKPSSDRLEILNKVFKNPLFHHTPSLPVKK